MAKAIEDMTESELDAELRANGIDPVALVKRGFDTVCNHLRIASTRIAKLERDLADARKAAEWVSVKDKMPVEVGKEFWCVVIPGAGIETSSGTIVETDFRPHFRAVKTYLSRSGEVRFNCGSLEEVTHWMEKPAPPITAPPEPPVTFKGFSGSLMVFSDSPLLAENHKPEPQTKEKP